MSKAIQAVEPIKLVEHHRSEAFADSALVARKFGMKHNRFVEKVESVLKDYPNLRERQLSPKTSTEYKFYNEKRSYRGQAYTAYLLNRPFFSLVAMRCETRKARDWQLIFNDGFYAMERAIEQGQLNLCDSVWVTQRKDSIETRAKETDVIKVFVEYATSQGSKHAAHYYKSLTNATYASLGLIKPEGISLRKTIGSLPTSFLVTAEAIACGKLTQYMNQELPYKAIFKLVKADLIAFCEPLKPMLKSIEKR